nr:dnaj protein jjj1 like [Quercus suber]
MESAAKRCHYEVLALSRDCAADEIRSAYKKLPLQRHLDKLVQSGLSHAEATAQFQKLSQAYVVLSNPKERARYDLHRSQILFSDLNSNSVTPNSTIPNLFSFFSNTVFS